MLMSIGGGGGTGVNTCYNGHRVGLQVTIQVVSGYFLKKIRTKILACLCVWICVRV